MIELPYAKLTIAETVNDAIVAAGIPKYPDNAFKFYGVSVFAEGPETIVYVVDDITPDEIAAINGIIEAQ